MFRDGLMFTRKSTLNSTITRNIRRSNTDLACMLHKKTVYYCKAFMEGELGSENGSPLTSASSSAEG